MFSVHPLPSSSSPPLPIRAHSFSPLEFPTGDGERAVAQAGNPRPWLGRAQGCKQANVEFDKGVCIQLQHNACAKKENVIFTSSAFSVYDGDRSQAMLYSVLVYSDAHACMELYREKYMVYSCRTLSIRQLLFQYQLLSCAGGGDVGWRNRVAALIGKCMWYFG